MCTWVCMCGRLIGLIVFSLVAVASTVAENRTRASTTSMQSHSYRVVHGWPILPDGETLGGVAGVAVDSHERVFVFHRSGRTWPDSDELDQTPIPRPTVTVFDARSGAVRARWGSGQFAMPHGLTVDEYDNVWLTDTALQQIYKFSADGHLILALGERGVAGNDQEHFDRPTAVAVAHDGSFYVSDGYRNTRIMKFSSQGRFLFQWGTKGTGPGEFDLPHWVALDRAGNVYVADRENARVQVFDGSGRYLTQWKSPLLGRPYAIAFDRYGIAYVVDGGDQPSSPPDRSAWAVVSADGRPVARIGRFGNYDGEFQGAHTIAVDSYGSVYVGDVDGARVQKFVRSE